MIWRGQNSGADDEGADRRERPNPPVDEQVASGPPPGSVGQRVESVIEAAERAAADIRRDAEEWAQRHMEETRRRADELAAQRVQELSTITDDLLARARSVAAQSDELIAALGAATTKAFGAARREGDDAASRPAPPPPRPAPEPSPEERVSASPVEESREARPQEGGVSEGARLLATQMAVAGSSRETIAARLRQEFGIKDPGAILDDAGL